MFLSILTSSLVTLSSILFTTLPKRVIEVSNAEIFFLEYQAIPTSTPTIPRKYIQSICIKIGSIDCIISCSKIQNYLLLKPLNLYLKIWLFVTVLFEVFTLLFVLYNINLS